MFDELTSCGVMTPKSRAVELPRETKPKPSAEAKEIASLKRKVRERELDIGDLQDTYLDLRQQYAELKEKRDKADARTYKEYEALKEEHAKLKQEYDCLCEKYADAGRHRAALMEKNEALMRDYAELREVHDKLMADPVTHTEC
jgi:chromosome segregation ATPase